MEINMFAQKKTKPYILVFVVEQTMQKWEKAKTEINKTAMGKEIIFTKT